MSQITELASAAITAVDTITIELVTTADTPSVILIHWPPASTVCDPRRYTEIAAAAMKVLATAVTRYNQLRAQRR